MFMMSIGISDMDGVVTCKRAPIRDENETLRYETLRYETANAYENETADAYETLHYMKLHHGRKL